MEDDVWMTVKEALFSHTGEIVAEVLREPPAKETKDLTRGPDAGR